MSKTEIPSNVKMKIDAIKSLDITNYNIINISNFI